MMQKQKLKACLLAIVGVACMSFSQNQFALQGTYTAPNGTEVYLINLDNRDTLGVTTVSDNKFSFTIQLSQPVYAFVGHDRDRVRFIMEPGTLMVNLDERTFKGNDHEFIELNELTMRYYQLYRIFRMKSPAISQFV